MNVVLLGYRAVGKTTVGRRLAALLGYGFADCDELVEARAGCSVEELFATHGADAFRELEHRVLAALAGASHLVVATGGGIVLDPRHPALLRALGLTVWLQADPDVLVQRIAASHRPRLTPLPVRDEVALHLAERTPLYAASAQWAFDTAARSVDEVAEALAARVEEQRSQSDTPPALDAVRASIDRIDAALLTNLTERLRCSMRAMALKHAAGVGVVDEAREREVVARWLEAGRAAGLHEADLEEIARAVIALCRNAQQRFR